MSPKTKGMKIVTAPPSKEVKEKQETAKKKVEKLEKMIKAHSLKQNPFKYSEMTIWEYYGYIQEHNVNYQPIGQRDDVQVSDMGGSTPSKAQSIVEAIFEGQDIGEIMLAGTANKEVLEGGHRTRKAVVDFLRNKFPLHKTSMFGQVYYSGLPDWARTYYRNYKLRIVDFYTLEGPAIGKQFVQIATQTVLKFVEKANAYGLSPSIIGLREFVRAVDYGNGQPVQNVTHVFFKEYAAGITDTRMKYLELLLESVGLHYGGNMTTSEAEIIEYLDNATEAEVKKIMAAVDKEYNFYANVASFFAVYFKKKNIGILEFGFLRHVYFYLNANSKGWSIPDYDLFTKELISKYYAFEKANESVDYVNEDGTRLDNRYAKKWDAFKSYVKKVTSESQTEQVRVWLSEIVPAVVETDPVRGFTREDLFKRWREVGECDEVSGDPLRFEDAVGAHIIPHSKGGETVYENLMVTTKYHNDEMGTMNAEEYKKMYLARLES